MVRDDVHKQGRTGVSGSIRLSGSGAPRPFRRRYGSAAWTYWAYVATTVGLACAVARWGWTGPVTGMVTLGVVAAAVGALLWCDQGIRAVPRSARAGLVTGSVVTAVVGLVAVLEVVGVLVVLLLVGTSPAVIAGVRVLWHSATDTPDTIAEISSGSAATRVDIDRTQQAMSAEQLASLDDVSLCLAWRRSFVQLEAAQSAEDRMAVVQQRQQCLDELQRRWPRGIAAWLSSGARASGNPLPFLRDDPHRPA